jgi:hypothetical protein
MPETAKAVSDQLDHQEADYVSKLSETSRFLLSSLRCSSCIMKITSREPQTFGSVRLLSRSNCTAQILRVSSQFAFAFRGASLTFDRCGASKLSTATLKDFNTVSMPSGLWLAQIFSDDLRAFLAGAQFSALFVEVALDERAQSW